MPTPKQRADEEEQFEKNYREHMSRLAFIRMLRELEEEGDIQIQEDGRVIFCRDTRK